MRDHDKKVKIEYIKPEVIATYNEQELEEQVASVYGISGIAGWTDFRPRPFPNRAA